MRKSDRTPEPILQALLEGEKGAAPLVENSGSPRRRIVGGRSRNAQYTGLDVSESWELKWRCGENRNLKRVVVELTLDKVILRDARGKS